MKTTAKPKYLKDLIVESDNFNVWDSEENTITKGGESSIGDNEVTSCNKGLSGSEFIAESTDVNTIFPPVNKQALRANGMQLYMPENSFSLMNRFRVDENGPVKALV